MARAVAAAISDGENVVVEAGTGTGKTLAYLVPALLSGRRVVVSTGTRTLQDQLFHRDLPVLCGALGRPADTVLLKGRANYLCLHRLDTARLDTAVSPAELASVERWAAGTRSGDIAELVGIGEDSPVWSRVTSTTENCLGAQCDLYSSCFVVRARQAALEADIVVVNHHLLLADTVLKEEGFGELLPGCEAVIVDEAHQFPDIAQGFFNVSVSSRMLLGLADDLRAEAVAAMPPATEVQALHAALGKCVADLRLALPRGEGNVDWNDYEARLDTGLGELVMALDDAIDWLLEHADGQQGLRRCLERCRDLSARLERITGGDETAGMRWAGTTRHGFSLNYTPVNIADNLRPLLDNPGCAWVFTSATLAVGQSFALFCSTTGLDEPRTLTVPSPFDYATNARLYVPERLPSPDQPTYTAAMLQALKPLLHAAGGRTFLLFTSHRALQTAAAELRRDPALDYNLLVQGEAPRTRLLEQFVSLPKPVLLGAASFWEGVDIRGRGLVLVAIDKLPFASPGDPMLKTRLEAVRQRGGNPFRDYQLPQAILGLKQGVGRLIRDFDDRGVVVVCDPRLTGRGYGRSFLASLPPFTRVTDERQAIEFLQSTRE